MKRWLFIGGVHCLVAFWSPTTVAQPAMVASTLFQRAVTKMKLAQFSEACPWLEQSYQLDAKVGTLFTLANCRDNEGKIASASARYSEYLRAYARMTAADQAKHFKRAMLAETRVRELEPQLPALKLVWRGELSAGVTIHVDDFEWARRTSGVSLPLDPGLHEIVVYQAGAHKSLRKVTLEVGQIKTFDLDVEVTFLKPEKTTSVTTTNLKRHQTEVEPQTNRHQTAGFVALGFGGASFVFGGIMGVLALAEKQTVDAHCAGTERTCDAIGSAAVEKMRTYANPSTAGFIAGGILAATGVVLIVTSPARSPKKSMAMSLDITGFGGGGMVRVKGAF